MGERALGWTEEVMFWIIVTLLRTYHHTTIQYISIEASTEGPIVRRLDQVTSWDCAVQSPKMSSAGYSWAELDYGTLTSAENIGAS